jgi:hypothetical protein
MCDFEIVEVSQEFQPLFDALVKCGIDSHRVLAQAFLRLTEPPESFYQPPSDRVDLMNSLIEATVDFDGEIAARMLRLGEVGLTSGATWKDLTRAERKRAKKQWKWILDAGLEVAPQGRPAVIDGALVVYCARIIAEACKETVFKFTRPTDGGPPSGKRWHVLMAAVPLAQSFLLRGDGTPAVSLRRPINKHAVAEIVTTMRSPRFDACCLELAVGKTARDVAERPASFRFALALARAKRRQARPKRPASQK